MMKGVEGGEREKTELVGKENKLFLNERNTKKYYIRIQTIQEGKMLLSIKIFFFLVVINNIVTKQRTSVGAKR